MPIIYSYAIGGGLLFYAHMKGGYHGCKEKSRRSRSKDSKGS